MKRYGGAVAFVAVAAVLRFALDGWLRENAPFNTFYIAVALAAWLCGTGPAICATGLGLIVADALFIAPRGIFHFSLGDPVYLLRVISYIGVTGAFIGIIATLKRREREAALARDEIRNSEARYSTVFHRTAVGIAQVDFESVSILDANDALAEMVGYSTKELRGKLWTDLVHSEDVKASLKDARVEVDSYTREKRLMHKEGKPVWVRLTRSLVRDAEGRPNYEIAVVEDISERKEAEQALRRSDERYRAFLANSSEGVWRMEFAPPIEVSLPVEEQVELAYGNGQMAECNDAMARMYALNRADDLIGKSLDFMLPASSPEAREFVASIIRAGYRAEEVESTERDANGNVVSFSNSMAGVVEDGRLIRVWGTQRDISERKRTEEALQRERERLTLALTAGAMGVYDYDLLEDKIWWAPETYQVFGVSPAKFTPTRESFLELIHPDDRGIVLEEVTKSVQTRKSFNHEYRIVRPDGQVRWMGNRSQTEYNDEGRPVRHFGVIVDITERKRFEERLMEQQRLLKSVTDNATVSLFIMDEKQQCVFMNPAAEELTGYALSELRGKPLHDVVHYKRPDGSPYPLSECPIDRAFPDNQQHGEEVFVHRDGHFYDVAYTASPIRDPLGKAIGTIIEVRNITEEKRAARAVLESEAVLRTVTNEAHVGLVMVNKERRYLYANHTYAEVLGLPSENVVGKKVPEVLSNVYDQIKPHLDRAFTGERVTYELRLPKHSKTEDERFYEVVYEPRVENNDEPYVVVVIVDITERKKMQHTLEQKVEERTAKLRETVGELEAFSYSIAHDMRAPLRAMQGYATILLGEYADSLGDGKDYLRRIASSANRLDALIEDVLNYSKIIRINLPLEPIDTEKFIREIVESYPNLQPPHAEIRIDVGIPAVLANPSALTQVVSNLLGNGVKFVKPGVNPQVRVSGQRAGKGMVRISFEDNGIGIPKEMQDRIFMMFQRLHAPGEYEGTGIGLTIVRKAVERMGGKVGVSSEGHGSVFWIELKEAGKP